MTQLRTILFLAAMSLLMAATPALLWGQTGTTVVITPGAPTLVTSPRVIVNNGPGNHIDAHVSGDLVSYTDGTTTRSIRYYRFSTAVDQAIPSPLGAFDSLSDVSGNNIVFTRAQGACDRIVVFDTASAVTTEVAPTACPLRDSPAIGNTTVAYVDRASGSGVIFAQDLAGSGPVQLSSGPATADAETPSVAPSGNVVVWEQCSSMLVNCDVMKAIRTGATWGTAVLVAASSFIPDTDGTNIVYDSIRAGSSTGRDIYFQPLGGGAETQLQIAGEQSVARISSGVIVFVSRATAGSPGDIFVYVIATNALYQITSTPTIDDTLSDVSVLPNGDIRVVWSSNDGFLGNYNTYATTFTPAGGDFSLGSIAPLTISAGGSGSATVTVNPLNGFGSAVNLSVSGQPAGVTASLSPNPVTPSGGNPASSVLNVSLPSFIVPTNFALTVTGTSGLLSHSTTANITVKTTTSSTSNLIGDLLNAGCIDNAGIGNALTSKLAAAQAAGNTQTAINILTALKNQILAQAGKHIAMSCAIAGVAFNPVSALLLDVQGLLDTLGVSLTPNPITGYVVNANGVGVGGATVSILNSGGSTVAVATTDITGYYFFATTGVLVSGSSYAVAVTGLPLGFAASTPAVSPAFAWAGSGMVIGNFVLN